MRLSREACARDLRERAFALGRAPVRPRVGVELEWIPLAAEGLAPVPPVAREGPATLPLLRAHGAGRGWREEATDAGLPRFVLRDGGVLSYEPGGQIELSSPACQDVAALDAYLRAVARPLLASAERAGVRLVARGIDPVNPVAEVPLHLTGERYRRQASHYERFGPAGARMMRQTAALHVNVDLAGDALARWRAANAAAPFLLAAFANSPRCEGSTTGRRSERAEQWRRLDPRRTGIFMDAARGAGGEHRAQGRGDRAGTRGADSGGHRAGTRGASGGGEAAGGRTGADAVVEAYLDFALDADAILLGRDGEPERPFGDWLAVGVDERAWRPHLSTLFPEVRPRGYLEVRSFDALPRAWWIVPAVVTCGLLYDDVAARATAGLDAGPDGLSRAGRLGVRDRDLREGALRVLDLALEGAARMGEAWFGAAALDATRAFRERFTAAGRDPGDEGWEGGA